MEGHPYLRLLRLYLDEFLPRDNSSKAATAATGGYLFLPLYYDTPDGENLSYLLHPVTYNCHLFIFSSALVADMHEARGSSDGTSDGQSMSQEIGVCLSRNQRQERHR